MVNLFLSFYRHRDTDDKKVWQTISFKSKGIGVLFVLCSVLGGNVYAQDVTVSGVVTDGKGSSLPGVSITIKGTTRGSNSDMDGKYSVSAPASSVLVFSFIGFTSKEVVVGNQSTIDVQLSDDIKSLEEVVVVGYGTSKRKDLTGSVQQVSAKDFNSGINPNPLQAIQGKVAGLTITQASGDPNANPTVRLRGYTSLAGGSDPLYVVDGVIGVPINSVSPDDIESMDVLKDASASAIYGSRAANGVIMITTKRGKSGKTTVSFNNYIGVESISNRLDLLDGDGYRAQVSRISGDASLSDKQKFPVDANGKGYNTDWIDQISRTGVTNNHDLAITGGSPTFSYRGSVNYINRQGIIKNTGFDRITGRVNLDQKAFDNRLNIQYSLAYTNTNSQINDGEIIAKATLYLPTLPVNDPTTNGFYEIPGSFDLFNPVAMQNAQKFDGVRKMVIGGLNLKYEVLDGLTLGVNGAIRSENYLESRFRSNKAVGYRGSNGRAERKTEQTDDKLVELTANYIKNFGSTQNSNFAILGGYSYQDVTNNGFNAYNNQFVTDLFGYNKLGSGAGTIVSPNSDYTGSYRNQTKLASFFGRATVNMNDKYNITGTLRYDGSSKFGANNKWALFPSVAGGWTISEESFFPKSNGFNYLKLRAGWGQTGNSEGITPYQSIQLYGASGSYYDGSIGDYLPGYAITQNANPNLKWEILSQANVGVDFQLAGGRFSGSLDLYSKTTKDMLYRYTVPADGVKYFTDKITANVGEMSNKGIEFSFGGDVISKDKFTWTSRIVAAYNKNKMVSLQGEGLITGRILYNSFGGRGLSDTYASEMQEGLPLGTFNNVPEFAGFSSDGKMLFRAKETGDTTSVPGLAQVGFKGNPQPYITGAWVNNFKYGNFDLSFQFRGVFGNKIMNNVRTNLALPGSILQSNMLSEVGSIPANYSQSRMSDYWMESGAFVRLDNWQVGYNLPVENKYISNARFYVGGNNLFVITKYKGIDPELEVKGDLDDQRPRNIGIDGTGIYPKTRSIQLGVNLTF